MAWKFLNGCTIFWVPLRLDQRVLGPTNLWSESKVREMVWSERSLIVQNLGCPFKFVLRTLQQLLQFQILKKIRMERYIYYFSTKSRGDGNSKLQWKLFFFQSSLYSFNTFIRSLWCFTVFYRLLIFHSLAFWDLIYLPKNFLNFYSVSWAQSHGLLLVNNHWIGVILNNCSKLRWFWS